ncbi:MAG: glycosyltransferase [Flavobacterium sp.]|nr:glycosyltransferase [Flavobacterium sp.]
MALQMESSAVTFAILIATKNRCQALCETLHTLADYIANPAVRVVVYDDGSTDGTYQVVKNKFPTVELWRNEISKGYLYCRNQMLNKIEADYLISLDDDAHFLTEGVLESIQRTFDSQPMAGVLAFRIFWSTQKLATTASADVSQVVKSFVGCGHVWRKTAWDALPNYPEWYQFYGEENWAGLRLFQQGFSVYYVPEILVHHRVDLSARAQDKASFSFRYRCSLRADWYTYFMLYPLRKAVYFWMYSVIKQLQKIIRQGQFRIVKPLFWALVDLLRQLPKLAQNRKPLTAEKFSNYQQLNEAKIYWNPEK